MPDHRLDTSRPLIHFVVVAAWIASLLLIAAPSLSQTLDYTITGVVFGNDYDTVFSDSGAEFFPVGAAPWSGGVAYTLTFSLNVDASQGVGAIDISTYPAAITDVDFLIGPTPSVDWATAALAGVEETIVPILTLHDWTGLALASDPGSNDAMPGFRISSEMNGTATVQDQGLHIVFADRTGTLFSSNPPELVAPDLSTTNCGFIEHRFVGGGVIAGMTGSIDTVSVPEPGFTLALLLGAVGLASL